jgi:co-chaperonin GroES (HSP10)
MLLPPELAQVQSKWRVLRDRVLVKRFAYENKAGLFVAGVKLEKGVIVAVGPGRRTKRLIAMKQNEVGGGREMLFEDGVETGAVRPLPVKIGDVVEFSPRNYTELDFDKLGCPGAGMLLVVWAEAIMLLDPTESKCEAMLFQQSAGFDRKGNFLSGTEHWKK